MKYLIAGLGNIGVKYENTRHNIGFKVLDALAGSSGIFFSDDRHAMAASLKHRGRTFVLIKPTTFMNLSGKAVNYWLQKEKLSADKLLVVTDDIALPFGKIRIRGKGSDGGHNGLKHIIQTLGHQNFPRLRFGVGNEFHRGQQVDYVLSDWDAEEEKHLPERIKVVNEAVLAFGSVGLQRTMSGFNNK